jgi:osmotically-inducible protein OsmY
VPGVLRVDNRLIVGDSYEPVGGTLVPTSRGWMVMRIQAQYFVSPDVNSFNIDVDTNRAGVVQLRGVVDSATAKSEAVRIARDTEGVVRVEDYLRVHGEEQSATAAAPMSDA